MVAHRYTLVDTLKEIGWGFFVGLLWMLTIGVLILATVVVYTTLASWIEGAL